MPAPEPRTHYQVSFTSRQAVLLFVVVLVSLAGAYFLGLLTGLAGRQPADGAAVAEQTAAAPTAVPAAGSATASDTAPALSTPAQSKAAVAEPRTPPPALAAREPGTEGGLQFFEDQPEEARKTTPGAPARKAAAPARAAGWFVQVLSTTSEKEAGSYRTKLSARGYRAAVAAARGPKGPQYRVRVGPYASREEAARAEETLVRIEKARTWIVSPGQ